MSRKKAPAKTPKRRMGAAGSESWHAMLDGAEGLLREEGYGALTSRRVAEYIGVRQQLVYYYFHTMDDLIAETFKRLSTREIERLQQALTAPRPLRQVWELCMHTADARLVTEFMALANRNQALRKEVIDFIEESRALQAKALTLAIERKKLPGGIQPAGMAMLAFNVGLAFSRELSLGINTGHSEILAGIEAFIAAAEPVIKKR